MKLQVDKSNGKFMLVHLRLEKVQVAPGMKDGTLIGRFIDSIKNIRKEMSKFYGLPDGKRMRCHGRQPPSISRHSDMIWALVLLVFHSRFSLAGELVPIYLASDTLKSRSFRQGVKPKFHGFSQEFEKALGMCICMIVKCC